MKRIGLILASYLILLAAVPCCVFDNCPDDKTGLVDAHQNGDEDCGSCSPFFSCEGCTIAATSFQMQQIGIARIKQLQVYCDYIQPALPTTHPEFWQPPKSA